MDFGSEVVFVGPDEDEEIQEEMIASSLSKWAREEMVDDGMTCNLIPMRAVSVYTFKVFWIFWTQRDRKVTFSI